MGSVMTTVSLLISIFITAEAAPYQTLSPLPNTISNTSVPEINPSGYQRNPKSYPQFNFQKSIADITYSDPWHPPPFRVVLDSPYKDYWLLYERLLPWPHPDEIQVKQVVADQCQCLIDAIEAHSAQEPISETIRCRDNNHGYFVSLRLLPWVPHNISRLQALVAAVKLKAEILSHQPVHDVRVQIGEFMSVQNAAVLITVYWIPNVASID